jgi:hypothetical protein
MLIAFFFEMSPLPLLKFGFLLTINFWANGKSFAWQHGGTRYSLIKLPHVPLAPYNSCRLVVMENQPPVPFWLIDELAKLQSGLELFQFTQMLLQPRLQEVKMLFPLKLAWESNYDTHPNGWRLTRGMQLTGKMSWLESRSYDYSHLNLKHVVIPRLGRHEYYLICPNSVYMTEQCWYVCNS